MGGGNKGGSKGGGGSNRKLNKVQQRFKQRESMGLSGLTGLKKGTEKKGKKSTIGIYRQYQKDSLQGRLGNEKAAARKAEVDSDVRDIKAAATARNNLSIDSANFGMKANPFSQQYNEAGRNELSGGLDFAKYTTEDFHNVKNYHEKLKNDPLYKAKPYEKDSLFRQYGKQVFNFNDSGTLLAGGEPSAWQQREDARNILRSGIPIDPVQRDKLIQQATMPLKKADASTTTDSSLTAAMGIDGLGSLTGIKAVSSDYDAGSTAYAMRTGDFDPASYARFKESQKKNLFGLNLGNTGAKASLENNTGRALTKMSQLKDKGIERNAENDAAINNKLSSLYNFSKKIPFGIGKSIERNVEANKPFFNRLNVDTPRANKLTISDYIANLDNMPDSTRRALKVIGTDNPNVPNKWGMEFAADAFGTVNPFNKDFVKAQDQSWTKPIQAITNNFLSGASKNVFQEAANDVGATGNLSAAEGIDIARATMKNVQTPNTLANYEVTKLQDLAEKYGGGTLRPTPSTIFRGLRRGGGGASRSGLQSLPQSGGGNRPLPLPLLEEKPKIIPQTGTDNKQLQNLQQQSYLNTLMMIQNDPRFMYAKGTPLSYKRSFNRRYF